MRFKIKYIIKYVLLILSSLTIQSSFLPWNYILDNNYGLKEFNNNKYADSEKLFLKADHDNPNNSQIKFNLASVMYKEKKYIESQSIYLELLKREKLDSILRQKIHYNLANVLYRMGQQSNPEMFWGNAIKHYEIALDIIPQDKNAKDNYEFVMNKLKKNNHQNQNNQTENKESNDKNNFNKNQTNSSDNSIRKIPQQLDDNISESDINQLMEQMKKDEESTQSSLNRRQENNSQNKNKSQMIKKDW
ncbi:MAG: hypothetical protein H7263_10155 [Candidatus Sericytochromatia bacterium]|nr:hypothetical protein [Candidatus Sericytochromatia bacterium]